LNHNLNYNAQGLVHPLEAILCFGAGEKSRFPSMSSPGSSPAVFRPINYFKPSSPNLWPIKRVSEIILETMHQALYRATMYWPSTRRLKYILYPASFMSNLKDDEIDSRILNHYVTLLATSEPYVGV
jgi:hypothetical protein